ncbi:DUF5677 domain-containing protein [Pseudorhodoferax soli]|uniref:DUF5677 domain-containing protein n=1 Tax=Pseudorhodoferax soli TaxID=545864 RepID=UPI000DF306D8|nr:DUF5677 domain-containing protein [Pseudorhodoferax soli]
MSQRVERFVAKVVTQQKVSRDDAHRTLLLLMVVRMHRFFQAVLLLVEDGLYDSAAALMRSFLEQWFVFAAVSNEPDLARRYAVQTQAESRKALSGLRRLDATCRAPELTERVLDDAIAAYGPGEGFNVAWWAERTGNLDTYLTLYRRLSMHAHGAGAPLEDYVQMDDRGEVVGLRETAAIADMPGFLMAASSMHFKVAAVLMDWKATDNDRSEAQRLELERQALDAQVNEYYAQSPRYRRA